MSNWRRKAERKKEIAVLFEEGRQAALTGKHAQTNPYRNMDHGHWYYGHQSVHNERRDAAQRIAVNLCGSCSIFTDALIADEPSLKGIDNVIVLIEQEGEIFLCDGCGWWCENEEMHVTDSGERQCGDCSEHD